MQVIHEEIDGIHYMDIILFCKDIEKMQNHEMVSVYCHNNQKPFYIGARFKTGEQDEEKRINWEQENRESDA